MNEIDQEANDSFEHLTRKCEALSAAQSRAIVSKLSRIEPGPRVKEQHAGAKVAAQQRERTSRRTRRLQAAIEDDVSARQTCARGRPRELRVRLDRHRSRK